MKERDTEINHNPNIDLQAESKKIVLEEFEKMGLISKLKAQIKSNVLQVLEKQKSSVKQKAEFDYSSPLARLNKNKETILACHLIKEFLQFYEMEYTIPIFENESNIRENVKKETLTTELSLQNNLNSSLNEPKPLLVQLIAAYHTETKNRLNNFDHMSKGLDESYGVKGNYPNLDTNAIKSDPISNLPPQGKKQLSPINFVNKSVDMKDNSVNESGDSNKFNTANIEDIYRGSSNNEFNKKIIQENNKEGTKTKYDMQEYGTNNKYDDEFNEVILEEISEGKTNFKKEGTGDYIDNAEHEESRKSITGSNNFMSSLGYDSSITNYKLDEFDHIEEVEKPN